MNGTSETGERSAVARANALAQYPENPTAVMIRPIESLYGQVFAEPTSVMLSVFLAPRVEIAVEKGDLWRQPRWSLVLPRARRCSHTTSQATSQAARADFLRWLHRRAREVGAQAVDGR